MRILRIAVLVALGWAPAFGETDRLRGVYVSDMDRSVDPCGDFFEYSNGVWRAANPIPASMTRRGGFRTGGRPRTSRTSRRAPSAW